MGEAITPVIRTKKKPRGKPFPKGHTIGAATRFVPGICPNPGGRPKSREFNKAAREALASDIGHAPKVQTYAEAGVAKQLRKMMKGDLAATTFLVERAEGRAAVSMTVDGGADKITIIDAGFDKVAEKWGRPEGWRAPLELPDGEDPQ
jgi:hypothetical protein